MAAAVSFERPDRTQQLCGPFPEIVGRTAELLLQDKDPDTICKAVFSILQERFDVDVYFHFLVSEDKTHLELASSGGNPKVRSTIGLKLAFGSAVCGTVARQCAPMYVTHVDARTDAMTEIIRGVGVRSYVCHPLQARGQVLGTLSFGSTHRGDFTSEELQLFAIVAQQVTLATERRAQNQRLRELERLATAGRMSATLAHEVNNPLDSLASLLYLLRNEVHSEDGEHTLDEAEAQVHRLSEIVQSTLEMFRGAQQLPRVLNAGELVHDLVAGLHLPNHARLETDIEDGVCVRMVSGELRQVLFNLLTNAAHFTAPGTPVRLSVHRAGSNAEIRVVDEGPGIGEEVRGRLFQPFFTTRGKEGTGIGLWLSKEMIERAGGRLVFYSEPTLRPGTEFVVTLPLVN